jgi:hypothetical protein
MKNKEQIVTNQQQPGINRANSRFTKLIITLTFLSICTKSLDFLSEVVIRASRTNLVSFSEQFFSLSGLFMQITYFLVFVTHALDVVLYFFNDKQLRARG